MEPLSALLAAQPLLALFLVVGLGYALGEATILALPARCRYEGWLAADAVLHPAEAPPFGLCPTGPG